MTLRSITNTTIQYILISNGSPYISPILPPQAFDNNVIDFLKNCPSDLIQLIKPVTFLEMYLRENMHIGYDFKVINIQDFESVKDNVNQSNQVQLFFLNGNEDSHISLYKDINCVSGFKFFSFYNKRPALVKSHNIVQSPVDFIEKIIERQSEIYSSLGKTDYKQRIAPSVFNGYKDFLKFPYFVPAKNNYFLLNRIIGNFGYNNEFIYDYAKHIEESSKAMQNANTFERQKILVEQVKNIDHFLYSAYIGKVIKQTSGVESLLSPLIMVIPFHNPDLKDIYGNNDIIAYLQHEQTKNYTHLINNKKGDDSTETFKMNNYGIMFQTKRLLYLDDIAFLHSSFSFSPIVRFPIKGKSLNSKLSGFRTKSFPNISNPKNRKKLKKTTAAFGKYLKESIMSDELEKYIKNRNGQIVAITDLPIEWMLIDGVPFSFTHDICRLPETTLHGLMSFYTSNQTLKYSIPKDILKKTLVILGSVEDSFKKWHKEVYSLSEKIGFIIVECKSLNDVKNAIRENKPDFLIFDCHGGFDEKTKSSYLVIGDEILDGKYIEKNEICAPMIFLSACGTAPTYGTINPIANAFFQMGAISVTSTYLPIGVDSGSVLYIRILKQLVYAAKHLIHKNWLEFISHTIRTSSVHDAYKLARKKKTYTSEMFESNVKSVYKLLIFPERRKLFHDLDNELSKLTHEKRAFYSDVIPEYLLYSNLGRGDLIYFEIWEEEHEKKNSINSIANLFSDVDA